MLKMVDGTGIIGVDMVCPLGGTVSPPQPPNYDNIEMEGVGSLMLPNSLKATLERVELIGNSMQGENPAPDNPQEIKSAGRKSKNLFDITKLKKGAGANYPTEIELVGETLIAKKDGVTANQMTFEIVLENLEPNTTYEFTTKQIICKRKDSDTEKAGTIFSFKAYKNESQIENKGNVFTTGESESDIYKIIFSVIAGDFGALEYVKFEQPMLSHSGGSYEPYSDKCLFDVKVTGKNLLSNKPTDWQIGKRISWSGYPEGAITIYPVAKNAVNVISLKPSTTYSIINNSGGIVINRIVERGLNKNGIKDHDVRSSKYTFVTNQNTMNAILQFEKVDGTELLSTDIEFIKIMLVEGEVNEPTPYEPYTEQALTLTSDRPITKWDKLVEQDGQIGWLYGSKIYVVTGNEIFEYRSGYDQDAYTNRFIVINDLFVNILNDKQLAYCKILKRVQYIYAQNKLEEGIDTNINQLHIKLSNDRIGVLSSDDTGTRTTKIIEYIKNTYTDGIEIMYMSNNSVFVPLPQSEQTQLRNLHSYNGTTNITVDSGEVPCGIKLTYRKEI